MAHFLLSGPLSPSLVALCWWSCSKHVIYGERWVRTMVWVYSLEPNSLCVNLSFLFFFLKLWILLTSLWLCFLIQNQVYNNRTFYKIVVVMKLVNTSNGLKQYVEHSKCSVLALFFIHYLFSFSFFNILKLFLCGKNNLRCFLLIYLLK